MYEGGLMDIIVDVQPGNELKWFRHKIESISIRVNFKYNYNTKKALITYEKPYLIEDSDLILISQHKKEIYKGINELRQIQFET